MLHQENLIDDPFADFLKLEVNRRRVNGGLPIDRSLVPRILAEDVDVGAECLSEVMCLRCGSLDC